MDKDKPKGVVYVDMSPKCDSEIGIAEAMQEALGWSPDPVIDSGKRKYNSSLPVGIFEANRSAAASVQDALDLFFRAAFKYKQEHKRVPVLIIDNANKLAQNQQEILNLFQDYAELAADQGTATVVFVSSEGRVPRRMMGKSVMFVLNRYYLLN
jgi:hypothetical protein